MNVFLNLLQPAQVVFCKTEKQKKNVWQCNEKNKAGNMEVEDEISARIYLMSAFINHRCYDSQKPEYLSEM